jgi:1-acyl-sn-glycerol-3-phosphate acyltransferase
MKLPEAAGLLLAFVARLITGAQGHWYGCPPKAEQRIYFANHQSHFDWVLLWAALPGDLRATDRSRRATTGRIALSWITRETSTRSPPVVSAPMTNPLELLIEALGHGDSLVIFPRDARPRRGAGGFKSGCMRRQTFPTSS